MTDEKQHSPASTPAQNPDRANSMWGGRFVEGPDALMTAINASIGFDQALWREDIMASRAHAAMLAAQGIISAEDGKVIDHGLALIAEEIAGGGFQFSIALEDIHMNVEARLRELIGPAAGRLHTARSRNDQVATDFKLWVRGAIDRADAAIDALQRALLDQADAHADSVMPGFTHLQVAQPVTLGHHLMAYYEMARRDRGRFRDARARMNECPLGAAALAGTSFPIDRVATATALGFDRPSANSLDSVSDRDFALEYMSAASLCVLHLSRLAEEFVIWSSQPYRFVALSDKFTTGSSIMPQKRNPDAAELVRAKSGRVLGDFQGLAMVLKGLPLAYSKDMQEDKQPVFDAAETLELCLAALTGMIRDARFDTARLRNVAASGFSTATDLADWLVRELGCAFRDAHHVTGALVKRAEERGLDLADLSLAEMQAVEPRIDDGVFEVLGLENSVASRTSLGGTAPERVKAAVATARKALGE